MKNIFDTNFSHKDKLMASLIFYSGSALLTAPLTWIYLPDLSTSMDGLQTFIDLVFRQNSKTATRKKKPRRLRKTTCSLLEKALPWKYRFDKYPYMIRNLN
uniref:Uncharacterized protein n=1 Tax=Cannabis sativa TaxID=3483 RepID=A0A803R7V6_CANSA